MMSRKFVTTEANVAAYEAVIGVFTELFKELKELGKKKPEATLGASKVKIINRVLMDAAECLKDQPDAKYLDLLEDDTLPQYGDAILVLSQYEGALKAFKEKHHGYQSAYGEHTWYIEDKRK